MIITTTTTTTTAATATTTTMTTTTKQHKKEGYTGSIVATGTISKLFRKYLSKILGKHKIKELQISAILDADWMDESE